MSAIETAAAALVKTCADALMTEATAFTCTEAETIAALFVACGDAATAHEFLCWHADGDSDNEDDDHRAVRDDQGRPIEFERVRR